MPARVRRGLLAAVVLVLAGAALSACSEPATSPTTSSGNDDAPVFNTAPRTTSRASSLVIIGYASRQNRALVEEAVAILEARGELATQRRSEIQRLRLNELEEIAVVACDSSCPRSGDILGTARPDEGRDPELVDCGVVLNMPEIRRAAREWDAPPAGMTALVLVHEQEHCLRLPDARESLAVAAEQRLARKLRDPRLVAFVRETARRLDADGYWK